MRIEFTYPTTDAEGERLLMIAKRDWPTIPPIGTHVWLDGQGRRPVEDVSFDDDLDGDVVASIGLGVADPDSLEIDADDA